MTSLEQKHLDELLASAIDPQIIELNFKSLDGEITEDGCAAADHLLYVKGVDRRSQGNAHYLRLGAGWWCGGGVDLMTFLLMAEWGCFKSDQPRTNNDGKVIKYEHPPSVPIEYFALRVPFYIGAKIAQRYGLSEAYSEHQGASSQDDEDKDFWKWNIGQKGIPLLITEGAKKGACLLSHGYLAIALSGVWGACVKDLPTLKPALANAVMGRGVVIVFDIDRKESTRNTIDRAAWKLSRACEIAEASPVTRVIWENLQCKGIDDLLSKSWGLHAFEEYLQDRKAIKPVTGLQNTDEFYPCPVCGDTSGKCTTGLSRSKNNKVKVEDGVLCASVLTEADLPNGWEFSKAKSGKFDKDGRGKLYPVTLKPSGESDGASETNKKSKKKSESHFSSSIEEGLVLVELGENGEQLLDKDNNPKQTRIGNHLKAIANVTTPEGEGVVLEFSHRRGLKVCTMTLYRSDLAGDGLVTLRALAANGYDWNYHQKFTLLESLHQLGRGDVMDATITNKTGWHDGSYVTGHKTYGDPNIRFGSWEVSSDSPTETVGSVEVWKKLVGAMCAGNSRLTLALGTAFCAPLIRLLEETESGGVHIYGDSSEGKTTSAKVAISVTGEKVIQTWNQTINALEGTAEGHNDSLMILDELHMCSDPKKAGIIAYSLANEEGKGRGKPDGNVRKIKNWKISYLSTGEKSLPEFLKAQGITIKAGQEVRMPSIPASPYGAPFGCFETIHGAESPEQFAMDLEAASAANRGVVGDAFFSRLVIDAQSEDFGATLTQRIKSISDELTIGIENSAVKRIARKRFALYLCALELAIDYEIIPFSKETAGKSIRKIFTEWLNDRGGDGSRDVKEATANFLQVIERNLLTNRVYDPNNSERALSNVLGYWDRDEGELCIPLATFETEFCKEVKKEALIKELQRLEILLPGDDGGSTCRRRPEPGGKTRRRYLVINLEVSRKIDVPAVPPVPGCQEADLERLLACDTLGQAGRLGHQKNRMFSKKY